MTLVVDDQLTRREREVYSNPDAADWIRRFDKDRSLVAPERFIFTRRP